MFLFCFFVFVSFGKIFPFVILVEDLPKKLPDTDSPTENDKPKNPKQTNWKEGLSLYKGLQLLLLVIKVKTNIKKDSFYPKGTSMLCKGRRWVWLPLVAHRLRFTPLDMIETMETKSPLPPLSRGNKTRKHWFASPFCNEAGSSLESDRNNRTEQQKRYPPTPLTREARNTETVPSFWIFNL